MRRLTAVFVLALLLVLPIWGGVRSQEPAPPNEPPPPDKPAPPEVQPLPAYLLKCVGSYGTFSKPALTGNNAMSSWKDKDGNLYVALKATKVKVEGVEKVSGGGIAIISPEGKVVTLDGKSQPFFPGDTIQHAWGDDGGKIYISTGVSGLVVIDTAGTPLNPADDTARQYSLAGVLDTTTGGEPKVISRSPCLGCDLVLYSWMDATTKDLYICAGSYETYEGGLTVLVWDAEKKDYTKSYTYRAFNWLLKRTKRKMFQNAIFDTTNAYDATKNEPGGGTLVKELTLFGHNQNCRRVWKDVKEGLIYVCREDTGTADMEITQGFNRDGGLTVIDTKKTPDPKDDTVSIISSWKRPFISGSSVTHFFKDEETGNKFVSTMDLNPLQEEIMAGVTVLAADGRSATFRKTGLYDTTDDFQGTLVDDKVQLGYAQVHMTLKDPATGNILVFESFGVDVIRKDLKQVSRIGLDGFSDLPRALSRKSIWITDAWIDKEGRIYVSLGEFENGLLIFKLEPLKP